MQNRRGRLIVAACGGALCIVALAAAGLYFGTDRKEIAPEPTAKDRIAEVVESEELLLSLNSKLKKLAMAAKNLQLPDVMHRDLFTDEVHVADVASAPGTENQDSVPSLDLAMESWPVEETERPVSRNDLQLWTPLLEQVAYFERAKFYFFRGEFLNAERTQWKSEVGFSGLARTNDNRWLSISAKQYVVWRDQSTMAQENLDLRFRIEKSNWQIESWHQKSMTTQMSSRRMFRDVLDDVLPMAEQRKRARTSLHAEQVYAMTTDEDFVPPYEHFYYIAFDRHPGIAVVDLDRDGFDDFYVMDRIGKNQFFHNQGDGTFNEIAAELGLDIENHCSSAVFADFDNDGDPDLFLGRTLQRSQYLENDQGKFVDRSSTLVNTELPYNVSSISAADYNGDGLLDLYLSTYAGYMVEQELESPDGTNDEMLLEEFLPEEQSRELYRRSSENQMFANRVGPPNVLLRNVGGSFELAPANPTLQMWKNTYQATWCDTNGDRRPDLYLANDFSPNVLYVNQGDETFVDVTETAGVADIGFGMGVSWGDYDNDGRHDLYVANMYSKAGRRITQAMDTMVDPQFSRMARGNSLFRCEGDAFNRVSGLDAPELMVEKAGWSWGGQFLDFNNDGFLDIYALSGYYSAPPEVDVQIDL